MFVYLDETRVCRFLVVRVLGVVPTAVGIHDGSKFVSIRRSGGEAAGQAYFGCIRFTHTASMRAALAQASVAAFGERVSCPSLANRVHGCRGCGTASWLRCHVSQRIVSAGSYSIITIEGCR
jgi:hypothetical protein